MLHRVDKGREKIIATRAAAKLERELSRRPSRTRVRMRTLGYRLPLNVRLKQKEKKEKRKKKAFASQLRSGRGR